MEIGLIDDEFPIRVVHTGSRFHFGAHWHEEVELVYVSEDRGRVGVNSRTYELSKGDLLLIKPGDIHSFLPGTGELIIVVFRLRYLACGFTAERDLQDLHRLFAKTAVVPAEQAGQAKLSDIMKAILLENETREAGYRWALKSRLFDLVVQLLRSQAVERESEPEAVCAPHGKFACIERVCAYLEDHYDENVNISQIADHVKFNKFYLCKLFKEMRGVTLLDYLNRLRITKAEWALLSSGDSILDIAVQHGFNNLGSFNRLFKKYNGCTPSQFRKRNGMDSAIFER
ncbi:AraC family transcriptional regulator [Paenibacillus humicola]|uniref:AraC family transcriptional regulator n=1 Tax=Paenibacillus humicola TaxID=3110540 RepID=UPI00237C1D06|nr:AraC family transcriptional regulator [Paenibacillus humicola]